ncbi:unnamed protein product [Pieris macdunnoughi]|uniref:Uncharacterized protein n=1 Tax=Pieris macdunnoughi TaxID=345717 RepID=A0A821S3R6_9NEOP|nr:unnamed protein product [Pieris macdunnoughi]
MWSSLSICQDEEFILKRLKKQLASISCKCKICEKYNVTSFHKDICITKKSKEQCRPVEETTKSAQIPCPGCFVAYNLLKRIDKTFKDEETDANLAKFSSDKSIQKTISGLDRTTSVTKKSVTYSDTLITDILNETGLYEENHKYIEEANLIGHQNVGNCLCLENFIDSIRPPLKYSQY